MFVEIIPLDWTALGDTRKDIENQKNPATSSSRV